MLYVLWADTHEAGLMSQHEQLAAPASRSFCSDSKLVTYYVIHVVGPILTKQG